MQGRRLEVIFPRDTDNDLVDDFIAVITSMAVVSTGVARPSGAQKDQAVC